jgi:hypothetical protein
VNSHDGNEDKDCRDFFGSNRMRPLPLGRSLIFGALQAAAALSMIQPFPQSFEKRTTRPRDFWKNARYPLAELRRLTAERGSGSVRRIDADVRATFEQTKR